MENLDFTPIANFGTDNTVFRGSLDGAGFKIKNLKIEGGSYIGLFGKLQNAQIKNLTVENANVSSSSENIGILAGYAYNAKIINCNTSGEIRGKSYVGGLVGLVDGGNIEKSYSTSELTSVGDGSKGFGGLVGGNIGSLELKINSSYFAGSIISTTNINYVGGIFGHANFFVTIENCYVLGKIESGTGEIGGIVGYIYANNNSLVKNCYFGGELISTNTMKNAFGISKNGLLTIENSYFDKTKNSSLQEVGFGRRTAEMSQKLTFPGWDFDNIWAINEGSAYPYLKEVGEMLGTPGEEPGDPEPPIEYDPDLEMTGNGTIEDPYIIKTPYHLSSIGYDMLAHYKLGNDLNMSSIDNFISIGLDASIPDYRSKFRGVFDGNGHIIKNLRIDDKSKNLNVGLFSELDGKIKNLTLVNCNIKGTGNVGAITGTLGITGDIKNCHIESGTIFGGVTGSIAGINTASQKYGNSISISSSKANVGGSGSNVGGLVGTNAGPIDQCFFMGDFISPTMGGGLVGYSNGNNITNCFVISDSAEFGIAVSAASANSINSCFYSGTAKSLGRYVTGFPINTYFNSTVANINTPISQARTEEQLKQKATFVNWNFDAVWDIDEGTSLPFLREVPIKRDANLTIKEVKASEITSTKIRLTWGNVSGAEKYEISYNNKIITSNSNEIVLTELVPETNYEIQVRSKIGVIYTDWSEPVSITTLDWALMVPQDVKVSDITAKTLSINWEKVYDAEGYILSFGDKSIDIVENSIFLDDLSPNTQYTFIVTAKRQNKESMASAPVTITTNPIEVLDKKKLTISNKTHKSMNLSWDKLDGAKEYEVLYNGKSINIATTNLTLDNLLSGTEYKIKIRGIHDEILGEWSEEILVFTDGANLSMPENIKVTSKTAVSVNLSWDAVLNADGYEVSYGDKSIETTKTSASFSDLLPNTEYTFNIVAKDNYTQSQAGVINVTTDRIKAINNIDCINKTYSTLSLVWEKPSGATKYTITYGSVAKEVEDNKITLTGLNHDTEYIVRVRGDSETSYGIWCNEFKFRTNQSTLGETSLKLVKKSYDSVTLEWVGVVEADKYKITYGDSFVETENNKITISNLHAYTDYTFKIQAINTHGEGNISSGLIVKTDPLPLDKVLDFECISKTYTKVELKWSKVNGATGYEIKYENKSVTTSSNTIMIEDLMPSTEYEFTIVAKSALTKGHESKLKVVTDEASMASPKYLISKDLTTNSVTLSWELVDGATDYVVKYLDKEVSTKNNSVLIGGLTKDTKYTFAVYAKNKHVTSEPSNTVEITTKSTPLAYVSNIKINERGTNSISLSWSTVPEATAYEIKYGDNLVTTISNEIIIVGLSPYTTYGFSIRAVSEKSDGPFSGVYNATTLRGETEIIKETPINVSIGKTYDFVFAGDNLVDLDKKTFLIKYDPEVLQLVDFATQTPTNDIRVGKITGTDLEITAISSGVIEFKISKNVASSRSWTGLLTIAKFQAVKTRNTTVFFEQ